MKVIDTKEYMTVLRELVEDGKEAGIPIVGNSMSPFLVHERDYICFRMPDRALKKGDMVFYQREDGGFIMHRICRVSEEGYYIIGDAQSEIEGPVKRDQIFAIVTKVRRKGKWIQEDDFWWRFFAKVWVNLIPCRRFIRRIYSGTFGTGGLNEKRDSI